MLQQNVALDSILFASRDAMLTS